MLRKTKGRQTIHKTVGHGFDAASQFRGDLINRDVENAGTNIIVQVFTAFVGIDQASVTGKVCHHAHFNLGVVGGQQGLIPGPHHKSRTNFAPSRGADGNILQIRIRRRQTPSGCDGLVECGVNATVGTNGFNQPIKGCFHFLVFAVREQMIQERVRVSYRQRFNFLGRRGIACLCFLGLRHTERFKQHNLQLLGTRKVQIRIVCEFAGSGFLICHHIHELVALFLQRGHVHSNARSFHARENTNQWNFQISIQLKLVDFL